MDITYPVALTFTVTVDAYDKEGMKVALRKAAAEFGYEGSFDVEVLG